jgi:hypothetical protein
MELIVFLGFILLFAAGGIDFDDWGD